MYMNHNVLFLKLTVISYSTKWSSSEYKFWMSLMENYLPECEKMFSNVRKAHYIIDFHVSERFFYLTVGAKPRVNEMKMSNFYSLYGIQFFCIGSHSSLRLRLRPRLKSPLCVWLTLCMFVNRFCVVRSPLNFEAVCSLTVLLDERGEKRTHHEKRKGNEIFCLVLI